jgi:hypothetical protein
MREFGTKGSASGQFLRPHALDFDRSAVCSCGRATIQASIAVYDRERELCRAHGVWRAAAPAIFTRRNGLGSTGAATLSSQITRAGTKIQSLKASCYWSSARSQAENNL